MQRTVISKLISGLNANSGSASVSGGSGITVSNGVVSVDNSCGGNGHGAGDTGSNESIRKRQQPELHRHEPQVQQRPHSASKVLLGNNSGFGIVCRPAHNNLTDYSLCLIPIPLCSTR